MTLPSLRTTLLCTMIIGLPAHAAEGPARDDGWQKTFDTAQCTMVNKGRNDYFVLEPGFRTVLEGDGVRLQITVLDETRVVAGVTTRVVEEREWKKGELYEVARNYFAICQQTRDVYYYGEDVDFYEKGKVVKHDGSWLAGEKGNQPGLIMAGTPRLHMKYYQEIAPGIAMDRAEIVDVNGSCKTPAGTFAKCLKVKEGSAIEPLVTEYKYHAPGIGLVRDEDLRLVQHGFVK